MRYLVLFIIGTALLFGFTIFNTNSEKPNETGSIQVVELFTSQGCSSCPAADKLLSTIADKENIIALSFHVSYWNYLGWKDPYSSEEYTQRQREYAKAFHLNTIYTPQIIVNGETEFVGSDSRKLNSSINSISSIKPITVLNFKKTDGKISFDYQLEEADDMLLNIALVERHVENFVPRGENSGRTLKHDNVVRYFDVQAAKSNGTIVIDDLPEFKGKEKSLILYSQDKSSFKIISASKVSF